MADHMQHVWYVQVRKDEEGPSPYYRFEVRDSETDSELSQSRRVTDVDAVRAVLKDFRKAEISARAMFGAVEQVDADKATDLLVQESGTRIVAKFLATRHELLASLALAKAG